MSGTLKTQEHPRLGIIAREITRLSQGSFFPAKDIRDMNIVVHALTINGSLGELYSVITNPGVMTDDADDNQMRYQTAIETLDNLNQALPHFQRIEADMGKINKQLMAEVLSVAEDFLPRLRDAMISENPDLAEDIKARFEQTESAMTTLQGDHPKAILKSPKNKFTPILKEAFYRTAPLLVTAVVLSQVADRLVLLSDEADSSNVGNRVQFVSDENCTSLGYDRADCALSERLALQVAEEGRANLTYSSTEQCESVHGAGDCNRSYDESGTLTVSPNLAAWSAVADDITNKQRIVPLYASAQEGMAYLRGGEQIMMDVTFSVK